MKKYFKNKNFKVGFVLVSIVVLIFCVSLFYTPHDPNLMNTAEKFKQPCSQYLLGTDDFGRDILSRLMKGSQTAFFVGVVAVCFGLILGVFVGALAGYFGGWVDEIVMRIIDAQMAFPGIILALIFITIFGSSPINVALALGIMGTPKFCRITRSEFLQIKEMDYIKAAKSRGASTFRIMFIHILPNITSSLIVTSSLGFSSAVLSEAGLSYLGLGIVPPDPSWGKMLYESQGYLLTNPWYAIMPGIMITIMVLGFNLLGDGIRDVNEGRN